MLSSQGKLSVLEVRSGDPAHEDRWLWTVHVKVTDPCGWSDLLARAVVSDRAYGRTSYDDGCRLDVDDLDKWIWSGTRLLQARPVGICGPPQRQSGCGGGAVDHGMWPVSLEELWSHLLDGFGPAYGCTHHL